MDVDVFERIGPKDIGHHILVRIGNYSRILRDVLHTDDTVAQTDRSN